MQRQTASLGNVFPEFVLAWDWGWRGEGLRGAAQAGCRQPLTLSLAEGSPILELPLLSCSLNLCMVCMSTARIRGACGGRQRSLDHLKLELQIGWLRATMWVLGTAFGSASPLIHLFSASSTPSVTPL